MDGSIDVDVEELKILALTIGSFSNLVVFLTFFIEKPTTCALFFIDYVDGEEIGDVGIELGSS